MQEPLHPAELRGIERKLRLIVLMKSAREVGLDPVRLTTLHVLAYLSDALAPVWHLPVMDGQLLKRVDRPFFPALQADLDALVGTGIATVSRLGYVEDSDGGPRLDADYQLRDEVAEPILRVAESFSEQAKKMAFMREVVYAASGLGEDVLSQIGALDAAYSNVLLHVGSVLDLSGDGSSVNESAGVALRFGELVGHSGDLSESEMVHLYIRHLYTRVSVA